MRSRRHLTLALLAAAALAPGAAAAAKPPANPPRRHTKQHMAEARRLLLGRGDFPRKWKAGRAKLASLTCPSSDPPLTGVVETGAAGGVDFRASSSGPFVAQSAWVYGSAAQASTLWSAVVTGKGLERCFTDSVAAGSTKDVTFTVTGHRRLTLPRLRARAVAYRVAATAATSGDTITVVYDLVVLGRGRAVTELSFAGFSEPVPRALELRLARLTALRLAKLPAG